MTLWLLAGLLTALVVAVLLIPLLRQPKDAAARQDYDLAVYRDQLGELDRDLARGILSADQAEAARTEIERRLLTAAEGGPEAESKVEAKSGEPKRSALAAVVVVALPAVALGLYLVLGAPEVPSVPFAERPRAEPVPQDMAPLVERLAARMAETPDDPEGWRLLGRTYLQLGRPAEAVEALRQALVQGADDPADWASLGEALVAVNQGLVVAEAREAFAAVLKRDPGDPRARYYGGLALAQDSRPRAALDTWVALVADAPADAPWREVVVAQIARAAEDLGLAPDDPALAGLAPGDPAPAGMAKSPGSVAPGPSAAEVEAASEMSPEARDAMIRSMVDGLAARLEEEPGDLDGWLRLSRAYAVLGEPERAKAAVDKAAELVAQLPSDARERQAVEQMQEALTLPR
jgi:cytochrome c-type biogenesis protein CcmH